MKLVNKVILQIKQMVKEQKKYPSKRGVFRENIELDFTAGEVLNGLYKKKPFSAQAGKEISTLVDETKKLIQPSVIYQWVDLGVDLGLETGRDVTSCNHSQLQIRQPATDYCISLNIGQHSHFFKHAEKGFIAIWTLGLPIDQKINKLSGKGKIFEAYIIDWTGLFALEKLWNKVRQIPELKAKGKKWGVSPCISPGSSPGWDIREQRTLCSIFDLEQYQIKINDQNVLTPHKTVTGLIGIGPKYKTDKVGSLCSVCSNREICPKNGIHGC